MLPQWRDEIAKGRDRAAELTADMTALVWKMIEVTAIASLAVGMVLGGILVWLIK